MFRRLRLALDRRVTVSNLLDELLRRGSDRVVSVEEEFVTLDGAHEPVQRVADMHREVCALGRFLVEDAGLRPGGLVGIWRTNDMRCLRWFLAIIRAGGIAVPLNPLLSLPEARRIIGHCGLDVLVTDRAHFEERSRIARPAAGARSGSSPTTSPGRSTGSCACRPGSWAGRRLRPLRWSGTRPWPSSTRRARRGRRRRRCCPAARCWGAA